MTTQWRLHGVRVVRAGGKVVRGILMKNAGDPLIVQRRTRIPEAPVTVTFWAKFFRPCDEPPPL